MGLRPGLTTTRVADLAPCQGLLAHEDGKFENHGRKRIVWRRTARTSRGGTHTAHAGPKEAPKTLN